MTVAQLNSKKFHNLTITLWQSIKMDYCGLGGIINKDVLA
jgi:hypothetical protein